MNGQPVCVDSKRSDTNSMKPIQGSQSTQKELQVYMYFCCLNMVGVGVTYPPEHHILLNVTSSTHHWFRQIPEDSCQNSGPEQQLQQG